MTNNEANTRVPNEYDQTKAQIMANPDELAAVTTSAQYDLLHVGKSPKERAAAALHDATLAKMATQKVIEAPEEPAGLLPGTAQVRDTRDDVSSVDAIAAAGEPKYDRNGQGHGSEPQPVVKGLGKSIIDERTPDPEPRRLAADARRMHPLDEQISLAAREAVAQPPAPNPTTVAMQNLAKFNASLIHRDAEESRAQQRPVEEQTAAQQDQELVA